MLSSTSTSTTNPVESSSFRVTSKKPQNVEVKADGQNIVFGDVKHPYRIPVIKDKLKQREWMLNEMAGAFRIFGRAGFNEGSAGHISVRDPVDPDTFWINPLAVHFSLLRPEDMVHVDKNGTYIGGNRTTINRAGFRIHSAIHEARPDVNCACHVHSVAGKAFSALGRPLDILNQDACFFYNNQSLYSSFGGVVLDNVEGVEIAKALGPTNRTIILQNHGLLTCGSNVGEACYLMTIMEKSCDIQLRIDAVQASGKYNRILIGDDEARFTYEMVGDPSTLHSAFCSEYEYEVRLSNGELKSIAEFHED
ncbi:unnamed protein product [Kuraishia capsulata CBS 1993]|uniref:Class II aldolase/adducin N-terminal domain-containing protein n=1 Tax=Kuraishia capsulata CBS 1993 TaxID=1382522 RepID=W6MS35_9ASCO|nr:uncharacterized protein KUCA_T00005201001 [Kuraishia capsulata CBS 1993]CDK29213.1 unnamed protein product [Kuraishia capsulata CBS 1993]